VRRPVRAAIRLVRVDQWVKNAFVFAGVLFTGRFTDPESLLRASGAFAALCAVAAAGYVDNDIADREADRLHPLKRGRPLPAGEMGVAGARLLQALLLLAGLGIGFWVDVRVAGLVVAYAALTVAYSRWLKHVVVLDVMTIATGFVLRVVAGCAAIHIAPSKWILLCTFMLALFLGFGKRRHEVLLLGDSDAGQRPVLANYSVGLLDQLIGAVSSLTLMCYIMFTMWPETIARHGTTDLVYTVPLVMYGLFRYDFLVRHEADGGNPSGTLLTDRHILGVVVLWALAVALVRARSTPASRGRDERVLSR
jgi:4-hydroxybenzoate polyprenyltransferase